MNILYVEILYSKQQRRTTVSSCNGWLHNVLQYTSSWHLSSGTSMKCCWSGVKICQ